MLPASPTLALLESNPFNLDLPSLVNALFSHLKRLAQLSKSPHLTRECNPLPPSALFLSPFRILELIWLTPLTEKDWRKKWKPF